MRVNKSFLTNQVIRLVFLLNKIQSFRVLVIQATCYGAKKFSLGSVASLKSFIADRVDV